MENATVNKPCRGHGRPRKNNNITINVKKKLERLQPSTLTETNMNVIVSRLIYGFNECVMRICAFFCSIVPTSPRDVNLQSVATMSLRGIARKPATFNSDTWVISLHEKTVKGHRIDETSHIDVHHDSFNLEMFAEETVIIENLNYWFEMKEHKFTMFKCESKVLGIVKFDGKYFLYDPNSSAITYNRQSTCTLVDCSDTVILAQEIRRCMEVKDLSVCTIMCNLLAVSVTSSKSSTTAHTGRRLEESETLNSYGQRTLQDAQAEVCGNSAKKRKCTDDYASTPRISLTGDCVGTTNKNELLLHICSLFCVIDVSKPTHLNLETVVQVTGVLMEKYPDFSIEKFDFLQCTHDGKNLLIYKIFGLNALNNELYDNYMFTMLCDKTILVNNLKNWFAMGYHEKTVFQCASKFFGLLKSETKYYLFDPNECLDVEEDNSSLDTKVTFSECSNVEELADALYETVFSKTLPGSTFACTTFAVNTLPLNLGSEKYVTTDPPTYERSSKVKGMMNMATLLSQHNELRLLEHRKKIREKYAAKQQNMSQSEKEESEKKHREYNARRWNNMGEVERQEELQRMREYSAEYWENMPAGEKEEALAKMKARWKNMPAVEKEKGLTIMKEYSAKRWENMSETEKVVVLEYYREKMLTLRGNMSDAERADELRKNAEHMELVRAEMTADEKNDERRKEREGRVHAFKAMNAEERAEYQKKNLEYEAAKRKSMTVQEKAAAKLKAKERYRNNHKEVGQRQQLAASIKKQLQLKVKKPLIKNNVAAALGGTVENQIEAETLVNTNLQHREKILNQHSTLLVTLYYTLKHRKERSDVEATIDDKIVTMLGTSLHTKHSEAYFPDTTYTSTSGNTYELDDNGLLKSPAVNENAEEAANGPSTWYCNAKCDVDVAAISERIHTIIEIVLKSNEVELLTFIDNIDKCDNRALADVQRLGQPKECYVHRGNHYGCSSVLLFLRSVSPHYPFMRNIVSAVYKVRRQLRKIRKIDTAINNSDVVELKKISDELNEKLAEHFVATEEWTYANETSITNKYLSAYVALRRQCKDLPTDVCISCLELCFIRDLRHIDIFEPHDTVRRLWDDLLDEHEQHNYQYGNFICQYCLGKFRNNTLPPTCLLNNLQVRQRPTCITRLNDYEQMLIQRAKAFQVVTRMGAIAKKNRPRQEKIQKVIGRTFHLPLPIEQTLLKMPTPFEAIAANQDLYILVRGLQTKQKQVFQSYVKVNNVYEALEWLRENNPLYQQIRLPASAENILDGLDNEEDIQFNDIRSQTEENSTVAPAMLTPKDVGDSYYEQVTLHSIGVERPNDEPSMVYQFKKILDKPIDTREKDLDLKCFPHLFCYGENGQFADRQYELPLRQFMKNKVKSVYSQFRLNIQYLFFLLNIINMRQIAASIFTAINVTPQVKNMTAKMLREKLSKNEFNKNASTIFTSLRNSKAFWNKPRNDMNCMVKYYGPATWFLTISPSEYDWDDLEKYLREINGQHAVGKTASAIIAMDPISTSRFIDNKFKATLKFICSKDGPLGEVEHYVWRREYQSRGLQHFHLMIWVKNAPILGTSTNDEVAAFISKYATCRIPDQTNFPTLYSRVKLYQQHYHNSYCMRTKKTRQARYIKRCRFDFPRPVTATITLRDVATSIHGRRKLKLKSRLYDLRRTEAEVHVNNYNAAILMAWEGNMDIQFIGEKTGALCAYITKYNTKPEESMLGDGFSDIAATKPLYSKLWLMGQRVLSNRECGSLEAADTILQISLFGTDSNTTIKWLDVRQQRNRNFLKWKHVESLAEDDTDLYWPSLIDTHYPNRPAALSSVCLFDFASVYEIVKAKPKLSEEFYEYGKLFVKRRKTRCLVNHYDFNMTKHSENYFHALLLLYKPFIKETELLGSFKTFAESFDSCKEQLPDALGYHEKMEAIARAKEELDKKINEIEAESQQAAHDECGSQNALAADDAINDMRACLGIDNISEHELSQMVGTLNADQSRVFRNITTTLLQQQQENANVKAIRTYVSGVGGTGKSHLIKVLRQSVKNELEADVIVAAPTGIAAQNVKGMTIHRFFRLPVEHGSMPEYSALSDMHLQQLRNELTNVKLIIIDEISMVSNFVLLFIHLRLQEIYNSFQKEDGWFGGTNIILFGDLLQLSPVTPDCPFVTLQAAQLSKINSGVPTDINLWADLFSYDELTINVRQKTDMSFANILSRIRLGITNEHDQEELEGRLIHFTFNNNQDGYLQELVTQLQSLPSTCVCLFATRNQCAELNSAMLSILEGTEIILKAEDKIEGRNTIQRQQAQQYLIKMSENSTNTAALEDTLTIKNGCKVMLRRNISSALVNGSIGTVKEIIKDGPNDSVSKIKIQFATEEYLLERLEVKFQVYANLYVVRSQFPITLAYGITRHKSQSLSLDCCLMDLGNSIFCDGQTYVALSRVTSLNGVYLVNYDPSKVVVNVKAIHEYNRLRRLYRPDLSDIKVTTNNAASRKDILWWKKGYVSVEYIADNENIIAVALPGFRNINNNCFANSTLQCLLGIASLNRNIMLAQDSELKRLAQQYNNPNNTLLNSDDIIKKVNMQLGQMQDATEFIMLLVHHFRHIEQEIIFTTKEMRSCNKCSYTYEFKYDNPLHHLDTIYKMSIPTTTETTDLLRQSKSKSKSLTMEDFIRNAYAPKPLDGCPCPRCKISNVSSQAITITDASNVFIISLNIFEHTGNIVNRLPLKLSGAPASILKIAGSTYKLKAATFRYGNNQMVGHYTAYLTVNNGWHLLNDTNISATRWPQLSRNAYILFYVKIGRV